MHRKVSSLLVTAFFAMVGMSAGTALAIVPPDQLPPGTISPAPSTPTLPTMCSCDATFEMAPWIVPANQVTQDINAEQLCYQYVANYVEGLMATRKYESVAVDSSDVSYVNSVGAPTQPTCEASLRVTEKFEIPSYTGLQCSYYDGQIVIDQVIATGFTTIYPSTIAERRCNQI